MGDVCKRVQNIFRRLDTDNSGGLSHQELFEGLKKMRFKPTIKLSIEEFDRFTENRRLCNADGELELRHWEAIILAQLKFYAERQLGQAIPAVGDDNEHMASLMFALQIMLRNQDFQPRDYIKRLERQEREEQMHFEDRAEDGAVQTSHSPSSTIEDRLVALEAAQTSKGYDTSQNDAWQHFMQGSMKKITHLVNICRVSSDDGTEPIHTKKLL